MANERDDLTPDLSGHQSDRSSPGARRTCAICLEAIGSDRQFGILENCDHIFCYRCIRQWRRSTQQNRLMCPQCRTLSHLMISSSRWFTSPTDKENMFATKLNEMASKPCRFFRGGTGHCRYGDDCRFLHDIDLSADPLAWDVVQSLQDHIDSGGDLPDWHYEYRDMFGEVIGPPSDAEDGVFSSSDDDIHSSVFGISDHSNPATPVADSDYDAYWSQCVDQLFDHPGIDDYSDVSSVSEELSDEVESLGGQQVVLTEPCESDEEDFYGEPHVNRLEISLEPSEDESMDVESDSQVDSGGESFSQHSDDVQDDEMLSDGLSDLSSGEYGSSSCQFSSSEEETACGSLQHHLAAMLEEGGSVSDSSSAFDYSDRSTGDSVVLSDRLTESSNCSDSSCIYNNVPLDSDLADDYDQFDDDDDDMVDDDVSYYGSDVSQDYGQQSSYSSGGESDAPTEPPNRLSDLVVRLSILGCPANQDDREGGGAGTSIRRKGRR